MAAFDYFLKLDGIPGESTDAKHKGEIDVLSWSWGESQEIAPNAGGGSGTGKVAMTDLHVSANLSKASPQLLLACAAGKHIKSAVLTGRKAGKEQTEFLTFSLSDVLVSGYQTGGATADAAARLDLAELLEDRDDLPRADGQGQRRPDPGRLGPQDQQGVLSAPGPATASPYDAVPYPGHPFAQTHPDRLATLATLFGLRPAPPERCRVLELGCGDGGQPRADGARAARRELRRRSTPRRRRSPAARRSPRELGLANLTLEARAIEELSPAPGAFDYVIAHGVYSWVPAAVRDRLLAVCRAALRRRAASPTSATTPCPAGACARRCATCSSSTPPSSPTRASASRRRGRCCASCSRARRASTGSGRSCAARPSACSPAATRRCCTTSSPRSTTPSTSTSSPRTPTRHGLQYLAEADFFEMQIGAASEPAAQALLAIEDPVRREQYLDFLKARMFRQTLLCRAELAIDRTPHPEVLERLAVSTQAQPRGEPGADGAQAFAGPTGSTLTTDHPLVIDALDAPRAPGPPRCGCATCSGRGRADDRGALCDALLRSYAANLVALHVHPPRLATAGRPPAGQRARAPPGPRRRAW